MELHPEELNDGEILRYLGYRGQSLTDEALSQLESCKARLCRTARARTTHRIFSLSGNEIPSLGYTLMGADIARHLAQCHQVVFLAATLGAEVDQLLMQTQVKNLSDALVLDACASEAIEVVCNHWEGQLRAECERRGEYLTERFSPGYGDLPLSMQGWLCGVLDTQRRMGLTVTANHLMIPRKSVTALVGICATPCPRRVRACESCRQRQTCAYRKEGTTCGR